MVNGIGQMLTSTLTQTRGNSQLDKDAFLHLLIMELKYQDPLDPLKDRDFIAQMAQFSSLEQIQNLGRISQVQQATSLIGRSVLAMNYTDDGAPEQIYGRVVGVKSIEGYTLLMLEGEREILMEQVVTVVDEQGLEQYLESIVGCKAYVRVYNQAGEVSDLREILITGYQLENGTPYLLTGEGENQEKIPLSEIWGVV